MHDNTRASHTTPSTYGWCAWHKAFSNTVRLVQLADQGSGPATPRLSACGGCRKMYRLTPLADQP